MEEAAPTISMSSDDTNMEASATKNSLLEDEPQSSNRGTEDDLSGGTVHIDEEEIDEGENGDLLAEEPASEPDETALLNNSGSSNMDQLDIFSLVARQQKLKAAQKQQSQLLVLASLYGQAGNRESFSQQSHTFTILKGAFGNKVPPFTIIDASDPENYPQRDALLDISGIGPVYPQFFLVKANSNKMRDAHGEEEGNSVGEEEDTVDLNDSCISLSGFMVNGLDEYNDIQFFGDYQDLFVANERRTLRSSFLMHKPLTGLGKEISSDADKEGREKEQECEDEDGADSNEDIAVAVGSKEEEDQENLDIENSRNGDEFIDATSHKAENGEFVIVEKHNTETAEGAEEIQVSLDSKVPLDEVEKDSMEEDVDIDAAEAVESLNNSIALPDEVEKRVMEEVVDIDADEAEEISNGIEPTTAGEDEAGDYPTIDPEETSENNFPSKEISGLGILSEPGTLDTSVIEAEEENSLGENLVGDNCEPSTDSTPAVELEEDAIASTEEGSTSVDLKPQSDSHVEAAIPRESPPTQEEEPQMPSSQGIVEKESGEENKSAAKKKAPVLGESRMKKDSVRLVGNLEVPEWVDLYFILPTNPVVKWTENSTRRFTENRKVETTMEVTLYLKDGEQVKQTHSTLEFT